MKLKCVRCLDENVLGNAVVVFLGFSLCEKHFRQLLEEAKKKEEEKK